MNKSHLEQYRLYSDNIDLFCSLHKLIPNLLIVLLMIFESSCSNEKFEKLDNPVPLKSKQSVIIPDGCYHDIFIIHDSLLVLISECDTNYFSVFDKKSLKLIAKFGNKGKGPYDFNFPFPFKTNSLEQDNMVSFDFYNLNMPIISKINFENVLRDKSSKNNIQTQLMNKELFGLDELCQLSDNSIAGIDHNNPYGLFTFYNEMKESKIWISYAPLYKDIESRYYNSMYYGTLCSNGEIIAYAYRYFDIVSFYDLDGKILKQSSYSRITKPALSKRFSGVEDSNIIYYTHSFGTKNNLLLLRVMQPWNVLRDSNQHKSEILCFDWKGKLESVYSLFYVPECFCFDERENSIYCIEKNSPIDGTVNIKKYVL